MRLWLTPQQSTDWLAGQWQAWEVEETILEDVERQHITEPVIVLTDGGLPAFAITGEGVQQYPSRRTQGRMRSK